jgi:hypothetical protein
MADRLKRFSLYVVSIPKKRLADLDTWLLAALCAASSAEAAFYSSVLARVWPAFSEAAISVPIRQWGLVAWVCGFAIAGLSVNSIFFGRLASRSLSLLENRLLG